MNKTSASRSTRRGYSLMEMMIVLSVLAGMTAMAWPMLQSPLGKLRLQAAAQEVSTELSKARLKAMQSGVTQVFRIQMNTGKFQVTAATEDEETGVDSEETAVASSESVDSGSEDRSPLTDDSDMIVSEKELPDGICFECPVKESETSAEEASETEVTSNGDGWTDLAVFYPNGGTSSAIVSLRSKLDLHLNVKLNGLTGSAKIGEAHRQEAR